MQSLIDDIFADFVKIVSEARGLDESAVRDLATGEVYLADRARELGLVDELGDLHRAIEIAVELTGAASNPLYLRPRRTLRQMFFGSAAESLVQAVADQVEQRILQGRFRL
jgi:protease-4